MSTASGADHSVENYESNQVLSSCTHFYICVDTAHTLPPRKTNQNKLKSKNYMRLVMVRAAHAAIHVYNDISVKFSWDFIYFFYFEAPVLFCFLELYNLVNFVLCISRWLWEDCLAHIVLPNAHYKQLKPRADAEMNLCWAAFTVNWTRSCVNEEKCSAYLLN